MNRIQLACYSLIASAIVLVGLLVVSLPRWWSPTAQASLVLGKDTLTLMTAKTRPDEEALFVLDGLNQKLLIYRLDLVKKQLELAGNADLVQLFASGGGDDGKGQERPGR